MAPLRRRDQAGEDCRPTSGRDVTSNFAGAVKISETKPAEDHHLSRFACYLIAMSGDPRKPEVAAALAYFAIRTREAETATSDLTQLSRRDILLMALEAEDRADQQQARAEVAERERDELAPVAGKFLDAEGDLSVRDAAQALTRAGVKVGQNRLFALLDERYGWIKRAVGDGRYRVIQSAIESGYMSVIPNPTTTPKPGCWCWTPTAARHPRACSASSSTTAVPHDCRRFPVFGPGHHPRDVAGHGRHRAV